MGTWPGSASRCVSVRKLWSQYPEAGGSQQDLPAKCLDALHHGGRIKRRIGIAQQRAAGDCILLGEHHARAAFGRFQRGLEACRPCADDEHVRRNRRAARSCRGPPRSAHRRARQPDE